ncbi:chromate transporter [Reyranella sp.]|uniref:chromate transporter n=1 Tax=Reyranella sp. TaxID=1929291 RepID=UPI003BAD49F0
MEALAELARTFASLSLVSIGGINVLLPDIRHQVVDVHGWMTDAAFAHTFAIASAAPGPNVIVVSLIGWQVAGLAGLVVSTLAIMVPPCLLALLAGRVLVRWAGTTAVALLKASLVPLGLGLMLAAGVTLIRTVDDGAAGYAISAAAAAFIVFTRLNPLWALAAGTVANIITLHLF